MSSCEGYPMYNWVMFYRLVYIMFRNGKKKTMPNELICWCDFSVLSPYRTAQHIH